MLKVVFLNYANFLRELFGNELRDNEPQTNEAMEARYAEISLYIVIQIKIYEYL